MSEEGKKSHHHHDHKQLPEEPQPQYGTFQGVANYPPPQTAVGFPQPVPPPGLTGGQYGHGYQTVPGYAVAEGGPVTYNHRLPCCGLGFGWFLFILGFLLGSIPWYFGAIVLLCAGSVDHREKPGYVACTIASVIAIIAIVFGASSAAM